MNKVDFDPEELDRIRVYKIIAGCVLPRPIGLISTIGSNGRRNVAPFSFFNALSADPPYVCVSIARHIPDGRPKDTLTNILDTSEFVVNIVSEDIASQQDLCAHEYPPDTDEFEVSGLTPSPSIKVSAPAVLEAAVNFECKLYQSFPLPQSSYTLVLGQVIHMRVRNDLLDVNGRIDVTRLAPVGRLAGNAYCRVSDTFTLNRDTFDTLQNLPNRRGGPG
jgi:flavin reductase (DIM6/NTAB) family NADH-FMN oxidoreductase RutF